MSYILFSTDLNRPLARVDASAETAVAGPGELILPCEADSNPDDIEHWRAEALKPIPESTPPTLEEVQAAKLVEVRKTADAMVEPLKSDFSGVEQQTWTKQEAEALAFEADSDAPTPTLDAIATVRSVERTVLIEKALAKVKLYNLVATSIIGQQQKYEDQITAIVADTSKTEMEQIESLSALSVVYEIPSVPPVAEPQADALPEQVA